MRLRQPQRLNHGRQIGAQRSERCQRMRVRAAVEFAAAALGQPVNRQKRIAIRLPAGLEAIGVQFHARALGSQEIKASAQPRGVHMLEHLMQPRAGVGQRAGQMRDAYLPPRQVKLQ